MTITSGTGLISGLDIEGLVSSLMAIEARPIDLLKARIEKNTEKQTALMTLQAQVLAVQLAASNFNKESIFQQKSVNTSNEAVMTATATRFAAEGTYRFTTRQLAASHSFVSNGFASLESGVGTGAISFEIGQGQLARDTDLSFLNGQNGVQNGKISITDRAGNTAEIDLTIARTTRDVIDEINSNSTINVTASASGDHLVITDNNDAATGTGNLIIAEVGTGHTAANLGILANVADTQIVGQDLVSVTANTLLSDLNDGNGVRGLDSGVDDLIFNLGIGTSLAVDLKATLSEVTGDDGLSNTLQSLNGGAGIRAGSFRITDQNGVSIEIDASQFNTLGELKTAIQDTATTAGMNISIGFSGLDHLLMTDNSTATSTGDDGERRSNFIIEDLDGGHAAADLGIVDDVAGKSIRGDQIWHMETLGDVINAVNNHWNNPNGNDVQLSINANGTGLAVDYQGFGNVTVQDTFGTFAAEDLGLLTPDGFSGSNYQGRRLVAGLNTVMLRSLNGGSGGDTISTEYGANRITEGGTISITDRDGNNVPSIDLSGAFTVQDVLDAINNAGTNITASLNSVGNGIVLEDSSAGAGNMVVTGDLATKLGIETNSAVNSIDSGNLQLQYISEATSLDDLRQGQGITRGKFKIIDGLGASATINLSSDSIKTLADVVDVINGKAGISVRASINENGDGLILEDTSVGTNLMAISVTEEGGSTASDLGLLASAQQAADGSYYIDGSYEFKLDLGGGDNIQDIVSKINSADMGVTASLINDGENYHINFVSDVSGRTGNVYLDAGTTSLNTTTVAEGRDAIILLGDGTSEHPLLITSSTNTIENAIKGTTLELVSVSDTPVDITVAQDIESITAQITSFVDAFNGAMTNLAEVTKFDGENYNHGVLFADHTASSIKSTMVSLMQRVVSGLSSDYNQLSDIGITMASLGSETSTDAQGKTTTYAVAGVMQLSFDEEVFRQAFADNPDAVAELFTMEDTGVGDYIADELNRLANTSESMMASRIDAVGNRQELLNDRIDYLDILLSAKETRLYNQFYAMEQALGNMQSQQQALASLSTVSISK